MKLVKTAWRRLLEIWAQAATAAWRDRWLAGALFALNFFTIAWQNIHVYKAQELAVLGWDAVFVLAGTLVFVSSVGLLPWRGVRRFLCGLALGISGLLGLAEAFVIYKYQAQVGAGIITAIVQTNPREATEFLIMYVGWQGLLGGLIVTAAGTGLYKWWKKKKLEAAETRQPISPARTALREKWQRWNYWRSLHVWSRLLPLGVAAGVLAGGVLWHSYHSWIVNDSLDIPVVRVALSMDRVQKNIAAFDQLSQEAATAPDIIDAGEGVPCVAFILGESTARNRLHLYGYPLENTPNLDELAARNDIAVFRNVIAPQGATVAVLRELFTFHDNDSTDEWYQEHNLIDVMKGAGYRTYWLSNQESSGIWGNVAQLFAARADVSHFTQLRESHEDNGTLDEALFPLVDEALDDAGATGQGRNFFVIHLMGGHGLYYMRYPYIFAKFQADDVPPPQDELSEERRTEIAQYENALYYNDFIVSSLIGKFAERQQEALVIYLPDHGEAVYDHGSLAGHVEENPTREMLEVPFIIWASPAYRAHHPEKWAAIMVATRRPYMSDDMIHTLLDLLDIRTPEYNPQKSVINPAFDSTRRRIVRGMDYDMGMKKAE